MGREIADELDERFHFDGSSNADSNSQYTDDSETEQQQELAREHYVTVDRSKLRDQLAMPDLSGPKYTGQRVSRRDLASASSEDEEDFGEVEESEDDVEDASEGSVTEEDDDEDSQSDQESVRFDTGKSIREELEELSKEDSKLLATIKKDASSDAVKGKHARNQLSMTDSLLDLRIRMQKNLILSNNLPHSTLRPLFSDENEQVQELESETASACLDLASSLLQTLNVMTGQKPKKRGGDFESMWEEYLKLEKSTLAPFRDETVDKWQRKVNIAGSASLLQKKFKALNQPIPQLIQSMMSTDKGRLMNRTRVQRNEYKIIADSLVPEESRGKELFDDTEFYSQQLNELINSKITESDDPTLVGQHYARIKEMQRKLKKQREGVDRKASKGRRLRFEVHDKLRNFMAPVETATWHDEMTEELFNSISQLHAQ